MNTKYQILFALFTFIIITSCVFYGKPSIKGTLPVTQGYDQQAPTPGNNGVVLSEETTSNSNVVIKWSSASDNSTSQSDLSYKVVIANSLDSIDSVAEAEAVGSDSVVLDWTKNQTSVNATNLSRSREYAFNVLVRDDSGNVSIYSGVTVSALVTFSAPTSEAESNTVESIILETSPTATATATPTATAISTPTSTPIPTPLPSPVLSLSTSGNTLNYYYGAIGVIATLSRSSDENISFTMSSQNGAAVAGTDYFSSMQTFTITPPATSVTFPVVINPNFDFSGSATSKNFTVLVSTPISVDITGNDSLTLYIRPLFELVDNDWKALPNTLGSETFCASKTDDSLWCWGGNSSGQVGTGSTDSIINYPSSVAFSVNQANSFCSGSGHSCAIKPDKNVWCWGNNYSSAIGNGETNNNILTPAPVWNAELSDVDAVSCGGNHTCALKSADKSVWCWGRNDWGQAGIGVLDPATISTPVAVLGAGSGGVGSISSSAGGHHNCVLKSDDSIWCWGDNSYFQLGSGEINPYESTPATIPDISNIDSIVSGNSFSCALKNDGSIWCWGISDSGELGFCDAAGSISTPMAVSGAGSSGVSSIHSGGGGHTCALKTDNSLWCWGPNSSGEIGIGNSTTIQCTPAAVTALENDVLNFSVGNGSTCAIKNDNTLWCWGAGVFASPTKKLHFPQTPRGFMSNLSLVGMGSTHSCGLKTDNSVWCWGDNSVAQLGIGNYNPKQQTTPVAVLGAGSSGVQSISTGYRHNCVLKSSDGSVWCWGDFAYGVLGYGGTTGKSTPVAVKGVGSSGVKSVSSGYYHNCALKTADNSVWCWGWNSDGQLGNGNYSNKNTPVAVLGAGASGVSTLSSGSSYNCALKTDNSVWCWGINSYGQLGNGNTSKQNTPVAVVGTGGSGVSILSSGSGHNCTLKTDNTVWCWGNNAYGQLGIGNTTNQYTPVSVSGLNNVSSICSGAQHSCALKNDNTLWCWGSNQYWELGNDRIGTYVTTPISVLPYDNNSNVGISEVICNNQANNTCVRTDLGTIHCWGNNTYGQLGNGYSSSLPFPVIVNPSPHL
ncbi:MAG: hypothetical protein HQK53_10080 [Oligoflexia bacterium]|nr:hypothetical protein [Oligoflexia bacterium]